MQRIFQMLSAQKSSTAAERARDEARRRGDLATAKRHHEAAKQFRASAGGSFVMHFIETLLEHFRGL